MVFKLDPVALVLDTFTFGIWSGYWNIQRITEYKYPDNINAYTSHYYNRNNNNKRK